MRWPPRKILVGVDFSPTSDPALEVADDLARRTRASVDLVHSVRDPARMITGYEVIDDVLRGVRDPERLRKESHRRLEETARRVGLTGATLHAVLGDPGAELVALRSILDADLLIAGTGHLRGIRRLFLGSVADRLLRNPGPPLLLVRQRPPGGTFHRVLVASEWTDRPGPALQLAGPLTRDLRGELEVLHVFPAEGYLSDERQLVLDPEREVRRLEETVREMDPLVPAEVRVGHGDPADVIPAEAKRLGADLVVLGAQRQPDGWPGRVTDRVARADLPAILVVWPASAAEA
jgi:nucleotide-binding universal stress UspA family protein